MTPERIAEIEVAALVATPTGKREWIEGPPGGVPANDIASGPGGTVFVRGTPTTTIVAEYTYSLANAALIAKLDPETVAELCRLARLGLRVESAPTTRAKLTPQRWAGPTWLQYEPLPNEWGGKRVALVVLEDSE